jgi:hypothetical protein
MLPECYANIKLILTLAGKIRKAPWIEGDIIHSFILIIPPIYPKG